MNSSNNKAKPGFNRCDLFKTVLVQAGRALLPAACKTSANAAGANAHSSKTKVTSRRKLGTLEVFGIGLGVQNMPRKYTTEVPYRPEMINIIRETYDNGVTMSVMVRILMGQQSN